MNNVLVLLACIAAATCNDIKVGSENGRKIFDEKITASPAIWRQVQKITINGSDSEVISHVVVTDEREEKDGDAKIVEGGEGQKNVTIELKSPTVFRGFDFHVVAYAVQGTVDPQQTVQHPVQIAKDTDVNKDKLENKDDGSVILDDAKQTVPSDIQGILPTDDETRIIQLMKQHQLAVDPIVTYVNEKTTVPADASTLKAEVTTDKNAPVSSTPVKGAKEVQTKDGDKLSPKVQEEITPVSAYTTDDTTDEATLKPIEVKQEAPQNFDSISKELGQKVLYGIKHH